MIELLALALGYGGFTALALATNRHHREVWNRAASRPARLFLRGAGTAGLAAALAACVVHAGWSVGPVLWLGVLAAAGIVVVPVLAFRPRIAAAAGLAALLLAVVIVGSAVTM